MTEFRERHPANLCENTFSWKMSALLVKYITVSLCQDVVGVNNLFKVTHQAL